MIQTTEIPKPLAIDLFAGLGGWSEGFLAEGWRVVGFDIERHDYGTGGYPSQLVLQDVLTIHGSQFRHASCIVASPPCQEFSYMAMPWKRAKQIAAALRGNGEFPEGYTGSRTVAQLTALFDACFRIQREACDAAGRYIPMVVENVKGAQPWVGRAKANFGSFFLWGDVGMVGNRVVCRSEFGTSGATTSARRMKSRISCTPRMFSERVASTPEEAHALHYRLPGHKVPGLNFHEYENTGKPGRSFQSAAVEGMKGFVTGLGKGHDWRQDPSGRFNSKSSARKAASAQIAKIPFGLSSYVASSFRSPEVFG